MLRVAKRLILWGTLGWRRRFNTCAVKSSRMANKLSDDNRAALSVTVRWARSFGQLRGIYARWPRLPHSQTIRGCRLAGVPELVAAVVWWKCCRTPDPRCLLSEHEEVEYALLWKALLWHRHFDKFFPKYILSSHFSFKFSSWGYHEAWFQPW